MMSASCVSASLYSLLLACALCSCKPVSGAFLLDWIGFGSPSSPSQDPAVRDGVPLIKVPYEELSPEDKFLREAEKYVGLKQSELDSCQHKVVMKIRASCASISEEELAKLSVNLLNCQSQVEGRQQFPCTENMSLRDCTSKMDSDMWNTYHLMNNRARAVCYAARHQQFRALSEMTVNKLMSTAHEQLRAMNTLKDGQVKLESLTSGTLDSVSKGHQTLMAEQEKLRTTQQSVHDFVALNLRELTREKALIAAGQRELAQMTRDVKNKLEQASQQLSEQSSEREQNHLQVLSDLDKLQNKAFEIWEHVDSSTGKILAQHAVASEDLENMLKNLAKINATIGFLLNTVEKTRSDIDQRLGWIIKFIGQSGEQLDWIQQCIGHAVFLVLGMVAASFVQAPLAVRCALLLIVPMNLILCAHEGSGAALDFPGMTILLFAFATAHWIFSVITAWFNPPQSVHLYYPQRPATLQSQNGTHPNGISVFPSDSIGSERQGASEQLLLPTHLLKQFLKQWLVLKAKSSKFVSCCTSYLMHRTPEIPSSGLDVDSARPSSCLDLGGAGPSSDLDRADESDGEGSVQQEIRLAQESPLRQGVSVWRSDSPASSRSSRSFTPVRSGTPKVQCRVMTRSGHLCRNSALPGLDTCYRHNLLRG